MSFASTIVDTLRELPRRAPQLAQAMHRAGATMQVAGDVVDFAAKASGPIQEAVQAVRDGRVRVELHDGRVSVRVAPSGGR